MGGCVGGSCVGGCGSVTWVLATSGLEELLRAKWEGRGIREKMWKGEGEKEESAKEVIGRESGRQIKIEVMKRAVGRERRK